MGAKKGTLAKIAEVVTEVTVNMGLTTEPEPQQKAARKAARKVKVAEIEEAKETARRTRRAKH